MPQSYKTKTGPKAKGEDPTNAGRYQIRLYPADIERIDQLVQAGYGANRSEVIRRSIDETAKWSLPSGRGKQRR
jgi:hypothetical protein